MKIISKIIILLMLFLFSSCLSNVDNFKQEYYEYLKNIKENGDKFTENQIIDLNNNKFLGFDENTTLDEIEKVFGKNIDKDVYSDELIWNVRLVYNANFNVLLKKDIIIAYEIKLPSNYLFKSKYNINGYENFKELISKLGKPESIEALDENWNAMNWFKDNRKIVFIGDKNSKFPTYMQYYLLPKSPVETEPEHQEQNDDSKDEGQL